MKRIGYTMLLFLACCASALAQLPHRYYSIAIRDTAHVPKMFYNYGQPWLYFTDPALDTTFGTFGVFSFGQAYPNARSSFLRDIYLLETDDTTLAESFHQYDPRAYYYVSERGIAEEPAGLPNDYINATKGCPDTPRELELIGAPKAWQITEGNPNTIIGIVDVSFQPKHPDFADSAGSKFFLMRDSVKHRNVPSDKLDHGIRTAGIVAGGTNNGKGLASIGWRCRLDACSAPLTQSLLEPARDMSRAGVKVINFSWNMTYRRLEDEAVVNEIYENGSSLICAAGNGRLQVQNYEYDYPASYPNAISVTAVGSLTKLGQTLNIPGHPEDGTKYSNEDVHERTVTGSAFDDSLNSFAHNPLVDICAPGYGVNSLTTYDYANPSAGYSICKLVEGTSFATPFVSGAVGLMQTVNKALSPYQREVILKKTAKNIYGIGTNYRYIGRLGAGRLQVDSALLLARSFHADDPATQTMYIDGVEFNHLCFDDTGSTPKPKFSVRIVNGNGHYRYEWEPYGDNDVDLDDYSSATPTVTASSGDFHYMLRVFDSSTYGGMMIPKAALKELRFTIRQSHGLYNAGHDLAMRDSYYDMLAEPNNQEDVDPNHWYVWSSPDLWNRKVADGIVEHEDPEYFSNVADSNFLYVRIRNVGCGTTGPEAHVKLYWTLSATGEKWPGAWDTARFCGKGGPTAYSRPSNY